MNDKKACGLRAAAGYHPGQRAEYETPKIHHLMEVPLYETHQRKIRSWDPRKKKIVAKSVEKVLMSEDGRTPRSPKMILVKVEVPGKPEGEQRHLPQTELAPVGAPVRLKKGSPKQIYRMLKRLDRKVGLRKLYASMLPELKAANGQ